MTHKVRIGIDLGGTKIAGVVFDPNGEVLAESRTSTPREDYQGTIDVIARMIDGLERETGLSGTVGIGIPGSESPATGLIQNGNSVWLNGRPLKADLERRTGREIRISNDADCFALSEAYDGAAAGAETVFGVILGTGCGGGIVVRGGIVTGPHRTGGEWGHMPLPWPKDGEYPGPQCWCGRNSCMEVWVSGPGLAADHKTHTGLAASPQAIVSSARGGDAAAKATLARHADRLARGLAVIVNTVDPHVIVLGGGLSSMTHLYDDLPRLMAPHIFSDTADVTIRPPVHGPASGVRGAARLWG